MHKDKADPSFRSLSSYGSTTQGHSSHSSSEPPKKFPDNAILIQSKEGPVKTHQPQTDPWPDIKEYAALPPVLPDLSPPAEPLSPLHSSASSDSERDMDEDSNVVKHSLSPQCTSSSGRTAPLHHSKAQPKEVPHLGGDAPIPASQTFPLPLSSKTNLANSRKPMALVRPMDGPDQINSESPDLKPSPDDYHGQSYDNFSDLKNAGKPNLPPLKIPSQSVEVSVRFIGRVENICCFIVATPDECKVCMVFEAPAGPKHIFMLLSSELQMFSIFFVHNVKSECSLNVLHCVTRSSV